MNVTENITKTLIVSGKGDTKQSAFASALSTIQKQVMEKNEDVMLQITPVSVQVVSAKAQTYTERFLFLFLPRKRSVYRVKLEVTVAITQIKMDQINFLEETINDPQRVALPFLSKKG